MAKNSQTTENTEEKTENTEEKTETSAPATPPAAPPAAATEPAKSTSLETHDKETGEVVPIGKGAAASIGGKNFVVKETVSLPMLSIDGLDQFAIKITKAKFEGKEVKVTRKERKDDSGAVIQPGGSFTSKAPMIEVIDLNDNTVKNMVVGKVLESTLEETYPNESYVGKLFIGKRQPSAGKAYAKWALYEIEEG